MEQYKNTFLCLINMLKWSEYDSTPIVEPTSPFPIKEPCKEELINKLYVYPGEKGVTFRYL